MTFRKANIDDVPYLFRYRKQQLIDEGASPDSNIDKELSDYFTSSITDESLISWLAVNCNEIIATSGICFYRLPRHSLTLRGVLLM